MLMQYTVSIGASRKGEWTGVNNAAKILIVFFSIASIQRFNFYKASLKSWIVLRLDCVNLIRTPQMK